MATEFGARSMWVNLLTLHSLRSFHFPLFYSSAVIVQAAGAELEFLSPCLKCWHSGTYVPSVPARVGEASAAHW